MRVASLLRPGSAEPRQTHVGLRLVLYPREAYRLKAGCPGIRVLQGKAWVSYSGTDRFANCGEELHLHESRHFAVVATVGLTPLIVEVLASGSASPGSLGAAPSAC